MTDRPPTMSSNPALVNIDRAEADLLASATVVTVDEEGQPVPEEFRSMGKTYTQIIYNDRRKKPRTSYVWEYGWEMEESPAPKGCSKKKLKWVCRECRKATKLVSTYDAQSTTHIISHLKTVHRISEEGEGPRRGLSVLEMQRHVPHAAAEQHLSDRDRTTLQKSKFIAALIAFIVCCYQPFSIVQSVIFQALLTTASDLIGVPHFLPTSHTTITTYVQDAYREKQVIIESLLKKSHSAIHLSFDLWTSPNNLAFAAIIAHFCSSVTNKIEAILIGFREIKGAHTGENIAQAIQAVLHDYNLDSHNLGCFVLDKAPNNDTCIRALGYEMKWSKKDCQQRCLRCMGHVINLCAQAFVFGAESELFDATLDAYEKNLVGDQHVKLWKLRGPIGKLHYFVVCIRRTPQRMQKFAEGNGCDPVELAPLRDNATRWNSAYRMIKRALQLRAHLEFYCFQFKSLKAGDDGFTIEQTLTTEDWHILTELADGLEVSDEATLALEGKAQTSRHGAMWESVPTLEMLSSKLIDLQTRFPLETTFDAAEATIDRDSATEFICESVNKSWMKFSTYYTHIDESSWYIAGLVFHPVLKWAYLEDAWSGTKWLATATTAIRTLWKTAYKSKARYIIKPIQSPADAQVQEETYQRTRERESILDSELFSFRARQQEANIERVADQYEAYLAEPLESRPPKDLIAWWIERQHEWPDLARFAFDALSIPAMAAQCERTFSRAKLQIPPERNALQPPTIEATMCCENWIRNRHA